jgi:hypothetical protein
MLVPIFWDGMRSWAISLAASSPEIIRPEYTMRLTSEYTCQQTVEVVVDGRDLRHRISDLLHKGKHIHFTSVVFN